MKSVSVSAVCALICLTIACPNPTCASEEEGTTTDSYLIVPTTIQPSEEHVYKDDFGVPDPVLSSKPTPEVTTSTTTSQAPDVVAPPLPVAVAPPAPGPVKVQQVSVADEEYKPQSPEIYSFHIESNVRYRYSRTHITSRVVNPDTRKSSEIRFRVVLPETAFISKFLMEIDGKTYESYVKEKEEAKRVYNQAQSQGQSAGLVELNTRNTNVFDVNVNIQAQSKVTFNLTYEELLSRRLGKYEQIINIAPEQITNVKDFQILVTIEESQNITLLRVPNIRNDVDAQQDEEGNNANAVIERPAGNKASISWKPSTPEQAELDKQQLTGKFIVQYDIKRELDAGEVLVMNGYFVHFFAPENLKPLRKHVMFVLDTSGSMWGRRIEQLKEAMNKILADLAPDDYFNIITFASDVVIWSPEDKTPISPNSHWSPPGEIVQRQTIDPSKRQPYAASKENIQKAQQYISSLVASGGTNIHDSVIQALNLTNHIKQARDGAAAAAKKSEFISSGASESTTSSTTALPIPTSTLTPASVQPSSPVAILPPNVESLIIFLTDGEPTVGVTNPTSIQTLIKQANANSSIPLFSLGFGDGADFPFLRKLSLQNFGFARKIYADSDAAIQLKGFYNEIASPLLSNVTFNYTSPEYSIENVTITKYATVFGGTEIAVAGKIVPKSVGTSSESEVIDRSRTNVGAGDLPAASSRGGVLDTETVVPTDVHYFDVVIGGSGRDGPVHFDRPEIYSSPIPWGVPVTSPFPPRPTVPPTPEDVFLERLWAYLTVRQLIDKDLAQETQANEIDDQAPTTTTVAPTPARPVYVTTVLPGPSGSIPVVFIRNVTVPETPKQRALRLALKYGFVTSLTSLVVVKPNSTDVTDSVSADAAQSGQSTVVAAHFAGNRISGSSFQSFAAPVPLSVNHQSFAHSPPRIVGFGGPPSTYRPAFGFGQPGLQPFYHSTTWGTPSATFVPAPTTATSVTPAGAQPPVTTAFVRPHTPMVSLATSMPTVPPKYPSSTAFAPESLDVDEVSELLMESTTILLEEDVLSSTTAVELLLQYSLKDIVWYSKDALIVVNLTDYKVAESDADVDADFQPSNCTISHEDPSQQGAQGQCVHLKDCVQAEFKDDFSVYAKSYFCSLESKSVLYAGVCCRKSD